MNSMTEIIGLIAASLTTGSFLPQVYKVWKTRSTESLSNAMLLFFISGNALWLIYGFLINSIAVIASSGITLLLQLFLVYFKYTFETKNISVTRRIINH